MAGYWLMKSEPHVYSFDDLVNDKTTHWDGVRNYQARNFMRDKMKIGDYVLFYHSNHKPPHIAGIARVSKEGYPDFTAFDTDSKYFDASSNPENPRWIMVDLEAVKPLKTIISLLELKENPKLENMLVVQKGQRLSVQPVEKKHFEEILRMSETDLDA
ncbi:MAG: EVE domain-containing protein [Methanobacteriota archaeon]|nr:MAG: EVE domain-containing protein [Euryarchaeota archaeon]|tara:strand:+ start:183 stop:656 length:474 start_codon:yes stop_codon:yes gene_type:complete